MHPKLLFCIHYLLSSNNICGNDVLFLAVSSGIDKFFLILTAISAIQIFRYCTEKKNEISGLIFFYKYVCIATAAKCGIILYVNRKKKYI